MRTFVFLNCLGFLASGSDPEIDPCEEALHGQLDRLKHYLETEISPLMSVERAQTWIEDSAVIQTCFKKFESLKIEAQKVVEEACPYMPLPREGESPEWMWGFNHQVSEYRNQVFSCLGIREGLFDLLGLGLAWTEPSRTRMAAVLIRLDELLKFEKGVLKNEKANPFYVPLKRVMFVKLERERERLESLYVQLQKQVKELEEKDRKDRETNNYYYT